MGQERPYLNAELFKVNAKQLSDALSQVQGYICSPYFPIKAEALFFTDRQKLWHLARLLELEGTHAVVHGTSNEAKLIALAKPKSDTYHPYGIADSEMSIYLQHSEPIKLENPIGDGFPIARSLLTKAIQSKVTRPLKCDGWTVYDESTDLTSHLNEQNRKVKLLQYLQVHTGFSFQFRTFGGELLVQILPRSTMSYKKSVWELLNEGWTNERIIEQFPYVKIIGRGSQKLIGVLSLTVSDSISEVPYFGRSFVDFATAMYPNKEIEDRDTLLVKVASSSSGEIDYFPSSWAYPSLTFSSIAYINENYYSELIGILKTQGRKRIAQAQEWATKFSSLEILGQKVEINPIPTKLAYDPFTLEPSKFSSIKSLDVGYIFEAPSVTMIRDDTPTEIVPGVESYQATVNDLLSHKELKPLDVPNKIHVIVFVDASLSSGWKSLKEALTKQRVGYRGFKQIFGVELDMEEEIVNDFLSIEFANRVNALPEQGYDCTIIVIPRYLGTPEETRRIYNEVKTMIMARGIPVQVIADDPRVTFGRSNTLEGKSKSTRTLFGISINVLAKVGTILTAIAESIANTLIPDSLTIGYNVARVIPRNMIGVKTIPLAAPLVIFDNRGAYISHQDVYTLRNEVSLFEQYGDEVFKKIPKGISTLIIHKDGFFTQEELSSLDNLSRKYGIETMPISIRTSSVPRVSNPRYLGSELGLKAGTVLPLSESDFLMMTTPFSAWNPERLGWPNPILITLHGSYDVQKKLQLLYHIFALTKMQTGSQRAVRLPISIHFANMIGRFLRRVGDPTPTYLKYFVQAREGGKYLPRWFL